MSKLKTAEDRAIAKIQGVLPDYNVTNKINSEGYEPPFCVFYSYYEASNPTSEGKTKINIKSDLLVGDEFSCSSGNQDDIKEKLRTDIEKILALSFSPDPGEITISRSLNKGNDAYVSQFTINIDEVC